jgi:hypothetical protein
MPTENLSPIDRVLVFHEQLDAAHAAGIPIQLDVAPGTVPLAEQLQRLASELAMVSSRGLALEDTLARDASLPARYRAALSLWLASGDYPAALGLLSANGISDRRTESRAEVLLIRLLIVVGLGYAVLLVLLASMVSNMDNYYQRLNLPRTPSVVGLVSLRDFLFGPGGWLPVLVMLLAALSLRRHAARLVKRFGRRRVPELVKLRHAACASLARSLEMGVTAPVPLEAFARHCFAHGSASSAGVSAEHADEADLPAPVLTSGSHTHRSLLRWAWDESPTENARISALGIAQRLQLSAARETAAIRDAKLSIVLPALLGGVVVLGLGLCLFLPFVELLHAAAQSNAEAGHETYLPL